MKKIAKIALFLLVIGMLASCASSRKPVCAAHATRTNNFERLPF